MIYHLHQNIGRRIKKLTPKEILQKIPILLAQVEVGNTLENILNEIQQIVYLLNRANKLLKKHITIWLSKY